MTAKAYKACVISTDKNHPQQSRKRVKFSLLACFGWVTPFQRERTEGVHGRKVFAMAEEGDWSDERVFAYVDRVAEETSYANVRALIERLPVPQTSGMVGITTYIRSRLCNNKAYVPHFPPKFWSTAGVSKSGAKPSAGKGKEIGRFTDLLFRKVVAGKEKLVSGKFTHQRCLRMFRCLEQHGIRCIATQTRVCLPELGIKTELDGYVRTRAGVDMVVGVLLCLLSLSCVCYTNVSLFGVALSLAVLLL
jgi:hypothetical protein